MWIQTAVYVLYSLLPTAYNIEFQASLRHTEDTVVLHLPYVGKCVSPHFLTSKPTGFPNRTHIQTHNQGLLCYFRLWLLYCHRAYTLWPLGTSYWHPLWRAGLKKKNKSDFCHACKQFLLWAEVDGEHTWLCGWRWIWGLSVYVQLKVCSRERQHKDRYFLCKVFVFMNE